jgi:hypothetical protein
MKRGLWDGTIGIGCALSILIFSGDGCLVPILTAMAKAMYASKKTKPPAVMRSMAFIEVLPVCPAESSTRAIIRRQAICAARVDALLGGLAVTLDHLQRLVPSGCGDVGICRAGLFGGYEADPTGVAGEAAREALRDVRADARRVAVARKRPRNVEKLSTCVLSPKLRTITLPCSTS